MRGLLLAVVLAAPFAAGLVAAQEAPFFCVIRYTPAPDFRTLRVVQDLELDAENLTGIAQALDADKDGAITTQEVEGAEVESRRAMTFATMGSKKLAIGGFASDANVSRDLIGFEGPVATAHERGKVKEVRDHTFPELPPGRGDQYLLEGGAGAEEYRVVVETVVFEAPPGWQLWSINGSEGARGNTTVTLPRFDTESRFSVVFAKQGYDPDRRDLLDGIPGPPLALLVGLLAVLAATLRRPAKR